MVSDAQRFDLEPLPTVFNALPSPADLKRQVLDAIDGGYNTLVRARGDVTRPEDTYEVQRRLASAVEQLKAFEAAFAAGRKAANSYQKEEFELALGDREVHPGESMAVPDAEGDLRVAADTANVYDIDVEVLMGECARQELMEQLPEVVTDIVNGDHPDIAPEGLPDVLYACITTAMRMLLNCGKFEPQVTKVKAYADKLARSGDDAGAAAINSVIRKTVKLKGVKVERKEPK